ncbi:hypothetical protein [Actinomadura formosensis]|uniref:hypothetical protein n=1 Tax=Actinomadura formosensis TaxID=60706 RepID=UPI003D8F1BC3
MNRVPRLLHAAYWIGAVADALALIPLLVPKAAEVMLGLDGFAPGSDYRYAAGIAAALMAGWTVLLVWADRRPVERRGVLLLTVCPVLIGLIASGGYAVHSGLTRLPYLAPVFVFQIGASVLFVVAYLRARAAERGPSHGAAHAAG